MRVVLPYGRAQIEAEIPDANLMGIAVPRSPINPAIDEAVEVERALHNPIGSPRLRDLARGRRNATIIVSDHTRPTPSGKLVPPLLEELEAAGIPAANVVVVFATGSHRPTRLEEMRSIFGEKTCSRVRVLSHECDAQDHVYMGETGINHTPVWVNRVVAESDIRISVSTVEPHQGAGWSGGAKNLLPGVCSRETIMRHHALYSHPGTCIGAVKGNPFREDLEQAASLVGLDFVVQVILSQKKQISRVFAGHWIEAHRDAVRVASDLLNYQLPEMADIVLASVGGTPRDSNLWQVEGKGLTRVGSAVRQGGVIIMVAECCEGVGHLELADALLRGAPDEILERFEGAEFTVASNKAYRIASLQKKAAIYLVTTGLPPGAFGRIPVRLFSQVDEALAAAFASVGSAARVVVVPRTPEVLLSVSPMSVASPR